MKKGLFCKAFIVMAFSFFCVFVGQEKAVFAENITGSIGLAGASEALDQYYSDEKNDCFLLTFKNNFPDNVAIANIKEGSNLNMRKGPGTSYSKVGILASDAAVIVKNIDKGWAEVTSGEVSGYVSTDYLITGDDAGTKADELKSLYATATTGGLRVRTAPSTKSSIICQVAKGEQMLVSKALVVNKEEETNKLWVEIIMESDTNDTEKVGYVALQYVTLNYELQWAVKYTPYGVGISNARVAFCDEAMKYIGTKYVWGGNDPRKGIDCSGFANYLLKNVSYTKNLSIVKGLERTTADEMKKYYKNKGRLISRSELLPGDFVFYANSSNHVFHIAIYIGNGRIVHSSTNTKGVGISNIDFITPPYVYYARVIVD